ncbi:NAD(P)-dependent oxidoreductase, partial [Patescibacteria group bacterium]|nr:NAD(P)-dependent oxidoreductase [Patescibacteria group bacterium]
MEYIYKGLQDLEKKGEFIKVGLVGAGQMGSGMVSVAAQMPGLKVVAIA